MFTRYMYHRLQCRSSPCSPSALRGHGTHGNHHHHHRHHHQSQKQSNYLRTGGRHVMRRASRIIITQSRDRRSGTHPPGILARLTTWTSAPRPTTNTSISRSETELSYQPVNHRPSFPISLSIIGRAFLSACQT